MLPLRLFQLFYDRCNFTRIIIATCTAEQLYYQEIFRSVFNSRYLGHLLSFSCPAGVMWAYACRVIYERAVITRKINALFHILCLMVNYRRFLRCTIQLLCLLLTTIDAKVTYILYVLKSMIYLIKRHFNRKILIQLNLKVKYQSKLLKCNH